MNETGSSSEILPVRTTAFVALVCVALFWFLNSDVGLDFSDEGFLWVGSLDVLKGQVPLRDFQSYFPGRYYWCAAFSLWFGEGLLGLRAAAAVFQSLALLMALLATRRVLRSWIPLFFLGVVLLSWMLLPFRFFDGGSALICASVATFLARKPCIRNHFFAGVTVGLATFLGLNHGVYAWAAFQLLILFLIFKKVSGEPVKKLAGYYAGIAAGLLPLAAMWLVVPGFFREFWEEIRSFMGYGLQNLPMPVPILWPWSVSWSGISRAFPASVPRLLEFSNVFSLSLHFVAVPVVYGLTLLYFLRARLQRTEAEALWLGATFAGFVYLRHFLMGAGIAYLGEGLEPFGLAMSGAASFLWSKGKRAAVVLALIFFGAASFLCFGLRQPGLYKFMLPEAAKEYVRIGNDRILLDRNLADQTKSIQRLVAQNLRPEEPLLLAPLLCTFYPVLGKEPPIWQIYFAFPEREERVKEMIRSLEAKKVDWAIVGDITITGLRPIRFSEASAGLWQYLARNFETVATQGLPPGYKLMRRKAPAGDILRGAA